MISFTTLSDCYGRSAYHTAAYEFIFITLCYIQ